MSRLLLVRHGQTAGFFDWPRGDDAPRYVDLTAVGRAQAEALGAHLTRDGFVPDRVVCGPASRHQQTLAAMTGAGWPTPEVDVRLDEHQGAALIGHADLVVAPSIAAQAEALDSTGDRGRLRLFRLLLQGWVLGSARARGVESWPAFRFRVRSALVDLTTATATASGQRVVAVTSGGVIGVAAAGLVGASDEAMALSLGFEVTNTSVTEVRFGSGRRMLHGFNASPHLGRDVPVTAV